MTTSTGSGGSRPDPRRPYRQPVAPRPQPAEGSGTTRPRKPRGDQEPLAQADIDAARDHAVELIEEDRGTQAAEVLAEVIPRVADAAQARELRSVRAVALFLAGDYRQALPQFDHLATAYARTLGPEAERTLECRRQAAYCRTELGDLAEALAELRAVLLGYRNRGQERDPEILELRRTIAQLQIATGQQQQAADALPALYEDTRETLGQDDPLAEEISEMLARFG